MHNVTQAFFASFRAQSFGPRTKTHQKVLDTDPAAMRQLKTSKQRWVALLHTQEMYMYAIDENRIASGKQFNAVCAHYTQLIADKQQLSQADRYTLYKRMRGAVGHYFGEVLKSRMTHGDVQLAFANKLVPSDILISIKIPASEPKAEAEPKVEAPKRGRGRPKGSKNKPKVSKETKKAPVTLEQRVDSLESKMDKILEILSK